MTGEDYEAQKDEHRPDWPGYDVQRWDYHHDRIEKADHGNWVWAADAEAHERAAVAEAGRIGYERAYTAIVSDPDSAREKALMLAFGDDCSAIGYVDGLADGREQAIRDCIAAVEACEVDGGWAIEQASALSALRALLDGE